MKTRIALDSLRPYIPGKPINDVKREFGLSHVIKLASNENPYGCGALARQAIIDSLADTALYPDGNCSDLKNELSHYLGKDVSQLIVGAGSDELIAFIAHTYIESGDEAITCAPTFPQYESAVKIMNGTMVNIPLINHIYDLDGMFNAITDLTKIIFIANPNNPTGTLVEKQRLLTFIQKVPAHILIVLDEAYIDYVDSSDYLDALPLLSDYPNLLLLRTFSKMFGLASLRVGYGVGSPEVISYLNKVRGPFNVSSCAQAAAQAALQDKEFVTTCKTNNALVKAFCYQKCDQLGLTYIPSYGNFFMVDCKTDSMVLFQQLQSKGYIVRPGFFFGMPTYQRVTFGTLEQMEGFFNLLVEFI